MSVVLHKIDFTKIFKFEIMIRQRVLENRSSGISTRSDTNQTLGTEDSLTLEISDLERRGIALCMLRK